MNCQLCKQNPCNEGKISQLVNVYSFFCHFAVLNCICVELPPAIISCGKSEHKDEIIVRSKATRPVDVQEKLRAISTRRWAPVAYRPVIARPQGGKSSETTVCHNVFAMTLSAPYIARWLPHLLCISARRHRQPPAAGPLSVRRNAQSFDELWPSDVRLQVIGEVSESAADQTSLVRPRPFAVSPRHGTDYYSCSCAVSLVVFNISSVHIGLIIVSDIHTAASATM